MEFFITLFNEVLFRPVFNLLVAVFNIIPDFGVAVIVVTFLIRFILYPLSSKALKSQKALADLQPKIKAIQKKYANDKEKQAKEVMAFYKEHNINPFSGCLPLLIQLPILIAMYRVFILGLEPERLSLLYPFVANPGALNGSFLGFVDLSEPSLVLAVFAGIFQFIQGYYMLRTQPETSGRQDMAKNMSKQMTYFMPIITVVISSRFPAGLPLYWISTNIFSIGQQWLIFRKKDNGGSPIDNKKLPRNENNNRRKHNNEHQGNIKTNN